ncbi:MAG TPA: UvrD-helicase domain-containing protein [Methanocorpusculum sp.]|nr:UvrD-helicase domain-containing protein [Methanocorpusculum sp.]
MMTDKLTDAQNEALYMEESVCVTAGAGTGKTFLLAKRYLASLKYHREMEKTGAGDILALTYTDKAVAEMRTKIGKALRDDPSLQDVWESFSRCNISTFHGFCMSLLKEFAYEAGLDAGFSVMDELDTYELVTGTIREMLERPPGELFNDVVLLFNYLPESTITKYIRTLLPRWDECKGWFAGLEQDPDGVLSVWQDAYLRKLEDDPAFAGDEAVQTFAAVMKTGTKQDILRSLREWICSDPKIFSLIQEIEAAGYGKGTNMYNLPGRAAALRKSEARDLDTCLAELTKPITIKKDKPLSEYLLDHFFAVQKILVSLPIMPADGDRSTKVVLEVLTALGKVTREIYEKVRLEKEHRGVLDFDDLIKKTRNLIRNEEIQRTLNTRYRYILIDEVQDNDPVQTEIVQILCGDPKENNRLFIVGDAKQSIYLFRGADVSGFNEFRKVFRNEPVELDTSFRTVPEIVDLVNHVFKTVFANPTKIWEAGYGELTAHREGQSGSVTLIRVPGEGNKAKMMITEAKVLASWIYDAISQERLTVYEKDGTSRPARFGDTAILIEAHTHLDKLRHALKLYSVPYTEEKGRNFYEKQEVFDFTNLLKAIVYPEEDVPLYGVLRSPWFGISDAELCRAASGSGWTLMWRLQKYAASHADTKISRAVGCLARWHAEIREEPLVPFLRRVIAESGIMTVYGGLSFGKEAAANLEKLVGIARSRSRNRPFSVYEFLSVLDTCMDEEFDEREGVVTDERDNRVKILTVHSSKGLEYPVLVLCFAGNENKLNVPALIFDEKLGAGISLKLPGERDGKTFVKEYLSPEAKEKLLAERKRLFYVGMTRARDHLVICGTDDKGVPGTNSFLSMYDAGIGGYEHLPEPVTEIVAEPDELRRIRPEVPDGWTDAPLPELEEETARNVTAAKRRPAPLAAERAAMLRGLSLHEVFEGKPAAVVAKRYGFPQKTAEEFAAKYAAFLAAPVMQNAVQSVCEQQVAFSFEGTPLNGVIDRLVRYADGSRMIIDYKTGTPSKMEMERYEMQLAVYFLWAKHMFGTDPGVCLYLADKNEVVRFIMDEERAKGLVEKIVGERDGSGIV